MRFDHVNLRTSRLAEMRVWYVEVLGLTDGWRPDFAFDGAWLYAGEIAVVHLIAVDEEPGSDPADLKIEHFAFAADDLAGFRQRLAAQNIVPRERQVPGTDILQFNIHDPDGNHIHVDFRTGSSKP
ncbi:MAG: VOC family protein [Pseudomonadota bacterium]